MNANTARVYLPKVQSVLLDLGSSRRLWLVAFRDTPGGSGMPHQPYALACNFSALQPCRTSSVSIIRNPFDFLVKIPVVLFHVVAESMNDTTGVVDAQILLLQHAEPASVISKQRHCDVTTSLNFTRKSGTSLNAQQASPLSTPVHSSTNCWRSFGPRRNATTTRRLACRRCAAPSLGAHTS